MSRNCNVQVAKEAIEFVGATESGQDYSGRNKHFRHAQRDHEIGGKIEPFDFGGGLKTCDREVKKGECTRTGPLTN
jgi:hypothetical protein